MIYVEKMHYTCIVKILTLGSESSKLSKHIQMIRKEVASHINNFVERKPLSHILCTQEAIHF